MQAAEFGDSPGTVQLLLDAAPGLAGCLDFNGDSPLVCAARGGCPATVEALLAVAPELAGRRSGRGHLPLALALLRDVSDWMPGSFHSYETPCRTAAQRVAAGRALLRASAPEEVLPILVAAEPELAQPLFVDAISWWRLAPEQWALVPSPFPGLETALPGVLARQDAQGATQVVRRLQGAQRQRLRHATLCLARAQRQVGVVLPAEVGWSVLAAVACV